MFHQHRGTDTPPIQRDAIEAIGISKVDLALFPGQLSMVARDRVVVEPDLVILLAPDRDDRAFERQLLAGKLAVAIDQPAPGTIRTVHKGRLHARLAARRIE